RFPGHGRLRPAALSDGGSATAAAGDPARDLHDPRRRALSQPAADRRPREAADASGSGKVATKTFPDVSLGSTRISPPWSRTAQRAMARPSPLPASSGVRY